MSTGTGTGLVMIAIGAILAFAVTTTVGFLDLQSVGWILMIVGAVGVAVDLFLYAPRRRNGYSRSSRYY